MAATVVQEPCTHCGRSGQPYWQVRCDYCGKVVPAGEYEAMVSRPIPKDWLRLRVGGGNEADKDLCSWACARDYALRASLEAVAPR